MNCTNELFPGGREVVDYEYLSTRGNHPVPICYTSYNLDTGMRIKHWLEKNEKRPLYSTDKNTLMIAFASNAELSCHLALGFSMPAFVLDLLPEFRVLTNGKFFGPPSLVEACKYCHISGMDVSEKELMRERILKGPPYSDKEKQAILDYCMQDVDMTAKLFEALEPQMDLFQALVRGRYMASLTQVEFAGIPLDIERLETLKTYFKSIKQSLIDAVDQKYHVYKDGRFTNELFLQYVKTEGISWKLTETGRPVLDQDYFDEQSKAFPQLRDLFELRRSSSQLKLHELEVGADGRNRTYLKPFRSKTGRNYPSSKSYIFGGPTWLRFLIKPVEGTAISYIDYINEEMGIAAALSGDRNLQQAYLTGDIYLAFAKSVGLVPQNATKQSHTMEREKCKSLMLGLNYGMGKQSLSRRMNTSVTEATVLLNAYKQQYRTYVAWSEDFVNYGKRNGEVETPYGWKFCTKSASPRTLMNFPMQAGGSDVLRLAVILCVKNNIKVIATVHDALMIESPIDEIEADTALAQRCMQRAGEKVLGGFKLSTEVATVRYPDNYFDKKGETMWNIVWDCIAKLKESE